MSVDGTPTQTTENPVLRLLKEHWATLILVIVLVVFIVQNTKRTTVDFLWLSFDSALWLVMLITTVLGLLIGALVMHRRARRGT